LAARYVGERISAEERRHARLAMLAFGLALIAICAGYVVLAAGDLFV
jgi:hypothetical protein